MDRVERVDLSVIIAARNAEEVLPEQLEALSAQEWTGSWEVIVADNGSTDRTAAVVAGFEAGILGSGGVAAEGGTGAGFARNVAMAAAIGEAFAFCDADDRVHPGWIAAMGDGLSHHDMVGGLLSFDALNEPWIRTAFYSTPPSRLETFEGIFPFSATCNLGVRRSAVDRIGGFDETFLTGQDQEFCLRAWSEGVELVLAPDAVVEYRYRPSIDGLWRRSRQYGEVGPAIADRLREIGAPPPPAWAGLRNWVWLVRRLPTLRTQAGRAHWVVVAGNKVGRVAGSIRHRIVYL